jgi:LmbE family N-acetylglucosaminyl deacetylase
MQPDMIFAPLRRDGSRDHDATFGYVDAEVRKYRHKCHILQYPIWAWRNPLLLIGPVCACKKIYCCDIKSTLSEKRRAIAAHRSQVSPLPPDTRALLSAAFLSNFDEPEEFFLES